MYKSRLLVVLAVLCMWGGILHARADQNIVTLLGTTYVGSSSAYIQSGLTPSRTNAARLCADRGGVLPTDSGANSRSQLSQLSILTTCVPDEANGSPVGPYRDCMGFYTAGTAQPTGSGTSGCSSVERVRELTTNNGQDTLTESGWDTGCTYRWNVGWYDRYTYDGEPGTAIWQSTWGHFVLTLGNIQAASLSWQSTPTSSLYQSGALNGYTTDYLWNATHQCAPDSSGVYNPACIPPHGYFYLMAGKKKLLGQTSGYVARVDVPETVTSSYPFTSANIVLVCEHQGVETDYYRTTTQQPQPAFRQGWKDETWAQSHWWVIFLIVAIVILAIIFIIAIYCLCTRRPTPTGPLLHSLVVRERDGHGYIVVDDEEDDMAPVNKNPLNPSSNQRGMPMQPQPQQQPQQQQMRSGIGFNQNQNQNPPQHDDPTQYMAPGFYNNGNNMQYNPNGGYGDAMPDANNMDMPGYSTEPPPQEPEPEPEGDEGELSKAPSALSRRRSSRRGKGRAASQTFSEVDLPQAGEIGEDNVEL